MAPTSCLRVLVISLLLTGGVLAAFTAAPTLNRPLKRRFNVSPTLTLLSVKSMKSTTTSAGDSRGIFGKQRHTNKRRFFFSLRGLLGKVVQLATQQKRKKLTALVFAAFIWLRGGGGLIQLHQGVPVAHAAAAAAAVEQVIIPSEQTSSIEVAETVEVEHIVGGDSSAEVEAADIETVVETEKPMKRNGGMMNGKVAAVLTGAVVLPSAGLLVVSGRNNNRADQGAEEGENAAIKPGESRSIKKNRDLVQNVLDKAKKARLKVDADTYLKSLQKEKSVITSAISKLTKQLESATHDQAEESSEVRSPVSTDSSIDAMGDTAVVEDSLPTNTELPLVTPEFIKARQQPKDAREEQMLQQKYEAIEDVGHRAFNILVDLGMIETDDESVVVGLPGMMELEEEPFQ